MKYALILALAACGTPMPSPVDSMPEQLKPHAFVDVTRCSVTTHPEPDVSAVLSYEATRFGTGWVVTCSATIGERQGFNTRVYQNGDDYAGACWVVLDFDGIDNGGGFSFVPESGGAFARYNPDAEHWGFGGWHMECDP